MSSWASPSALVRSSPLVLGDFPLVFLRVVATIFGLLWGSFLNVVIYRAPRGLSVVRPPSTCPACQTLIAPYDNIPVVSWLLLRGKARCCGAKISVRYPLVELMGGLLSLAIFEVVAHPLPLDTPWFRAGAVFLAYFTLALALVAAAFIDAEHMYLPDPITLGGTVLGVVTATLRGMSLRTSVTGAIVGFVMLWLPFIVIYPRLRGRQGMGLGDAKLIMLAGAWFGSGGAFFTIMAGAIQGTLGAVAIYLTVGKIEEPEAVRADREELQKAAAEGDTEAAQILADDPLGEAPAEGLSQARLPFGPFLILAMLEFLFFGERIERAYRGFIGFG
jgi:leader peptidase (prepilin peptidase)/N-methyltransferase